MPHFRWRGCCATLRIMKIEGDYGQSGYALVRELIPQSVAHALMGIVHRRLLPTEHSLSLTLAYSDGKPWPLEIWSAHLFLHWIDPDGPHSDRAFDAKSNPQPVELAFED